MGAACSTHNKVHVSEPTIMTNSQTTSEKDYPVFPPNAIGLRQLAQYNRYPLEVKNEIDNKIKNNYYSNSDE